MLAFLFSYLLGSISPSHFFSQKIFNSDLSKLGSGNLGSTNMARNFGKKWGILVMILDALKGIIAVYFFGLVGAIAVVLGHCQSIFLNFRGGKGVATALGIIAYFDLSLAILALILTLVFYALKWEPFMAHLSSMFLLWLPVTLFYGTNSELSVFLIFACILIPFKHRPNIEAYIVRRSLKNYFQN